MLVHRSPRDRRQGKVPELAFRFGFTLVELLVVIAIVGVLIALLLPALLGVIALAIDGGYAYAQRRQMQNAADAAAVAGARAFALQSNVNSEVSRFTSANGASSFSWRQLSETQTDVLTNLSINLTNIEVTANVTFDTFFARIVGINQMTATATNPAAARSAIRPKCQRWPRLVAAGAAEMRIVSAIAPGSFRASCRVTRGATCEPCRPS